MATAEILWPPHPYRAGFCITDDTDAATLAGVRGVYDLLASIGLKTTKTVWAFSPSEPCGIPPLPDSILRGITLEDPAYHDYCMKLRERGFEICLHGASAGNNVRERTARALTLIERRFGGAGTFICHAKNAENPYWHDKVAPRAVGWALAPLSRYRCSGEDPASPYYWGDLCLQHVRHIRLFRTRDVNTLATNPSMPYHDPEKPRVRGWFAATKRSFHDCTAPAALEALRRDHGLCVLYQYMHRYADPVTGQVDPTFRRDAERLMADGVLVDTTSALMDRLRLIQGVFLARRRHELWVVNLNDTPVPELQIRFSGEPRMLPDAAERNGDTTRLQHLPAMGMARFEIDSAVEPRGPTIPIDSAGHGVRSFGFGRVFVNVGLEAWEAGPGLGVGPRSGAVVYEPAFAMVRSMSRASPAELYGLLAGQFSIIADEVLRKGRSVDSRKFLGSKQIALEDHSNW